MGQDDKDDPRNCPKCGHFNGPLHEYDCPAGSYGPKLPSLEDLHAMGLTTPSANDPDPTPAADGGARPRETTVDADAARDLVFQLTCRAKAAERDRDAVVAERDALRRAVENLTRDGACSCDDYMVTPPGEKCYYCRAIAALAPAAPPGDAGTG